MFNLKHLTLDSEEAYGNVLKGLFKQAIIQAAMIKDAKKAESWCRKWSNIEKVTWILHKKCSKKGIFDLT